MKKDLNSSGRIINNSSENQLFGFWVNYVGSIWLNANVNLRYETNDGKQKFLILRNNNDIKDARSNGVQYLTKSNIGDTSWGHTVSIGINIFNESALGYMYEVVCFNKALSDDEINTITN